MTWQTIIAIPGTGRYRIHITQTESSEEILRYNVRGGSKQITLEKRLRVHRQPWELVSGSMSQPNMRLIIDAIEEKLKLVNYQARRPRPF